MRIQLEDLRQPDWQPLHVGDRERYATATSVAILDPRTIVCCSLLARKMYLIRLDLGAETCQVIDRADTTFEGASTETDLCTARDGLIVTSNCKSASMSLYRVVGDRIRHVRDLSTGIPNYCHGARLLSDRVVVAAMINDPLGAYFFDLGSMRQVMRVGTERLPKDVLFLSSTRAVVIATSSQPQSERSDAPRESEVMIVDFDLDQGTHRVVARRSYGTGQFDSVSAGGGRLFIADSYRGSILVVSADTLDQVDEVDGYPFPHGVDVGHGMMAVACYGDNSVHVSRSR